MRSFLLVLLALTALAPSAHAEQQRRYQVDLIVFSDSGMQGNETPQPATAPDLSRAVNPDDQTQLSANRIDLLPGSHFGLGWQWHRLRNAGNFTPLMHLSWTQTDPPARDGAAVHVHQGPSYPLNGDPADSIQQIDGKVALYGGDLLHIDADLSYTEPGPDGSPVSWHLKELRRVKLNEVHFIDGGAFGLLVRVSKAPQATQ